jgi:putative protein kinase ArgK-like GTPase of G3E family
MPAPAPTEPEAFHAGATDAETNGTIATRAHYAPPWADVSIIGIAGSSGSGKSTLSQAIVSKLNLPWVVILSIVSLEAAQGWVELGLIILDRTKRIRSTRAWIRSHQKRHSGMSTTLTRQM